MIASMTVESPTDGEVFLAYLDQVLCPTLCSGQVVVMDNLSAHKVEGGRQRMEAGGAQLLYLPPYSPDFNPIEQAWFKTKHHLRSAKSRTVAALEEIIPQALRPFIQMVYSNMWRFSANTTRWRERIRTICGGSCWRRTSGARGVCGSWRSGLG